MMWDQIERKSRRIEAWRLSVGIACLPLYSLHHLDSWVMDRGKGAKIDFLDIVEISCRLHTSCSAE